MCRLAEIFDTVGGLHRARRPARGALAAAALPLPAPRRAAAAGAGWSASPSTRRRTSPTSEQAPRQRRGRARGRSRGDRDRRARADGDPVRRAMPAATRVTHERPALERITMERAALQPHPRWRRFIDRVDPAPGPGCDRCRGSAARRRRDLRLPAAALRRRGSGRPARRRGSTRPTSRSRSSTGPRSTGSPARSPPTSSAIGYDVVATTNTDARLQADRRCSTRTAEAGGAEGGRRPRGRGEESKPLDRDSRERAAGADVVVIAGEDRA